MYLKHTDGSPISIHLNEIKIHQPPKFDEYILTDELHALLIMVSLLDR